MASNERVRKYLEAGAVLGEVARARTTELVREVVASVDAVSGQLTGLLRQSADIGRRTTRGVAERMLPWASRRDHRPAGKVVS